VRKAKLQLDHDKIETEEALISAMAELEAAKSNFPFNSSYILECKSQVEGLSAGLTELKKLEEELF
jgi:hypothetical protein